jgi:N-acetylglucosamine kinase-like BadF-type ATPase
MKTFLGVDGGGSKTEFLLIDGDGRVLARHQEGSAYYFEIGLDALHELIARGVGATLAQAGLAPAQLSFAFFGLPAYGEDSRLLERLDRCASPTLAAPQYRCGNDMVCGWAGALACGDGINIVAGTGSIAYGEFAGRNARAGGWGELFSDEGSAYWVAREGLNLFSRMSDGRAPRGELYDLLREHFELQHDLDLCAAVYGANQAWRSNVARLASVVAGAARRGDGQSGLIFERAVRELRAIADAVREGLAVPPELPLPVSYSGGMFKLTDLVLEPLRAELQNGRLAYRFLAPRLPPGAGAALLASRREGAPLSDAAVESLAAQLARAGGE